MRKLVGAVGIEMARALSGSPSFVAVVQSADLRHHHDGPHFRRLNIFDNYVWRNGLASWTGNVCMEYVVDDAREQSFIRYAIFEKNSKFVNYDLGRDDIEDSAAWPEQILRVSRKRN
jgi:hypothetical protein